MKFSKKPFLTSFLKTLKSYNYLIVLLFSFFQYLSFESFSQVVFDRAYQSNTIIENVWQTSDKGYIAGGNYKRWDSLINDWNYDHYILKTDSLGNIEWENTYDFTILDGMCVEGSIVRELQNGDFAYISSINCAQNPPEPLSKYLLIRLKHTGDTVWTRTFERPKRSMGQWFEPTKDGGFVMTGYAADWGTSADVYIVKADSMGNETWNRAYQLYGEDQGACVRQTSDGGYIVAAGSVLGYPGDVRTWLLRLNYRGDTIWTKTYPWGMWNVSAYLDITPEEGFIVAVKDSDYYQVAFKTDSLGDLLWDKNLGQGNACITQTNDTAFALFGLNYFVKIDKDGNTIFEKNDTLNPRFWQKTSDKGYIAAKENRLIKTDCQANYSMWDTINCPLSINNNKIENYLDDEIVNIYPNPTNGILKISSFNINSIQIFNSNGVLVRQKSIDSNSFILNLDNLSNGLYFLKFNGKKGVIIRKILKE